MAEGIAGFSPEYVKLVEEHYKDMQNGPLTPTELNIFLTRAASAKLDPLSGQLIPSIRRSKDDNGSYIRRLALVTSIDALRLIADRTDKYAPGKDTEFGPDGASYKFAPEWAKVYVRKFASGTWHEYSGIAYFSEYVQTTGYGEKLKVGNMWQKMPHTMIAKCAEALALRRGFPNELQGLYTFEEMAQADNEDVPAPPNKFGEAPRLAGSGAAVTREGEDGRAIASSSNPTSSKTAEKVDKRTAFPFGNNLPEDPVLDALREKLGARPVVVVQEMPLAAPESQSGEPEPSVDSPAPPKPPEAPKSTKKRDKVINKAQRDRLWAIQGDSKCSKDDLKAFLKTCKTGDFPNGLESTAEIPVSLYDIVIAFIQGKR